MKAFHEVRNYDSDLSVWHSAYENIGFLGHWHKELEFIYIRSGSAAIRINDNNFTAHAGDLVFCDSGDIHYSSFTNQENAMEFLLFDPQIISTRYQFTNFSSPLITREMLETLQLQPTVNRLFSVVPAELSAREPYYQEIIKANIREFWYLLRRKMPSSETIKSQSRRNALLDDLQKLLAYLDENYYENITLNQAAGYLHFSPSHFSKTFSKLTGTHFVTYLNRIRVEHAATMIKNSPQKMTEIALSCGFNNIRTFNRVFKEITGYTPSQFAQLPEEDTYNLSYHGTKSHQAQFVKQDSLTLIKNPQ